ncbi:MAG: hypothetical protein CMJ18_02405 [Phycisphaeraceae bacterium]|nr:hypothetical protein [Phycisphaeraceae bacterium]
MGFFSLSSAWLLLLVPPLVALYFLKLRRPRLEVPSLVLWRQVLADQRVNSPFQRFKRNILFWLQLLLLALVILAAMQPYWRGSAARAVHVPVLIDVSASMAARTASGESRLVQARKRVQSLIDGLLPDQKMALISFDKSAAKLTGFTNNKRLLSEALDRVRANEVPSDLEEAMRLSEALSRTVDFDQVLLYSDGNFPTRADFELPFTLDYRKLDAAGPNLGITAFNARRSAGGQWEVFVSLLCAGDKTRTCTVELFQDGAPVGDAKQTVSLAGGESERLMYRIESTATARLEVRLEPDGHDALDADNVAFLDLQPARPLRMYVPPKLVSYRTALGGMEGVELAPAEGDQTSSDTEFDVVISDDDTDLALDAAVYFLVGVIPSELSNKVWIGREPTIVIDWDRTAPLLQHVQLAEMIVVNAPETAAEMREEDFEGVGYEVIAWGRRSPLVLRRRQRGRVYYHTLFDTDQSLLPFQLGFPILLTNLVQQGMHHTGLSESRGLRTGVLPPVHAEPETTYEVRGPGGLDRVVTAGPDGQIVGVPTQSVGRYEISGDGQTVAEVGVSLLDEMETSQKSVDRILFNDLAVAASDEKLDVDRSFWSIIAILALVVLVSEWWFFQKRPGAAR